MRHRRSSPGIRRRLFVPQLGAHPPVLHSSVALPDALHKLTLIAPFAPMATMWKGGSNPHEPMKPESNSASGFAGLMRASVAERDDSAH